MSTNKKSKILKKIVVVLIVVILVAAIALAAYDMIAQKMSISQVVEHFETIWEKAYVWGTTIGVAGVGSLAWASVKISQVIAASSDFGSKVNDLNLKNSALSEAVVGAVKAINSVYKENQEIMIDTLKIVNKAIDEIKQNVYDADSIKKIENEQNLIIDAISKMEDNILKVSVTNESKGE